MMQGATVTVQGSSLGSALLSLLNAGDIVLGAQPGYKLCQDIYLYHPLGGKIAEKPVEMAQSQKRKITVPDSPEQVVVEAFEEEWEKLKADSHVANLVVTSRIYGIAAIALMVEGQKTEDPIDFDKLWNANITFNVYDPLNLAGSQVLNQNPLAMDFQHAQPVVVNGAAFHRSRALVQMHERPIYLDYQSSAFGFSGRSVYQRALFPLKTFISTMIADDMAARKVGLLVAMIKQGGSIIDGVMEAITAFKRVVLQQGQTNQVLSIGQDDKIESLNLQNLDGPLALARKHCLENVASAVPMPAKIMTQETLAEGFGEGTEDAKQIAQFVDKVRENMELAYKWMDKVVRYRAWNPEFYKTIQKRFPDEYGKMDYDAAFYKWTNSFKAEWPSLLKEPDSELVKVDDVKLRAVVALLEVFLPMLDPDNRMIAIEWACDAFNELKLLFGSPLNFDYDKMREFAEEQEQQKADAAKALQEGGGEEGETEDPTSKTLKVPDPPKGRSDNVDRALVDFRRSLDSLRTQNKKQR